MESITITYRGENFCLVPKNSGNDAFLGSQAGSRSSGSDLQRFDDPELQHFAEYKYSALPENKKMIRLLKLMSGAPTGREIFCELIEATYDKKFHIPTISPIDSSSSSYGEKRGGLGAPQAGDGGDDEGNRSEQEDRWKPQKVETEGEALKRAQRKGKRQFDKLVKELSAEPDKAKAKEESRLDELVKEWEGVKKNEVQYEALSWTWGSADEQYVIFIKVGPMRYKMRVRKQLALALKYLRRPGEERILWIDAICINQDNLGERNHQVQLMSRIYTRASQVCVWLGEGDSDSEIAINFIKEEIRELKNFDTISSTPQYSRKWRALMSLMQREWFFRRWVVQEIALARAATVYCGPHSVPWKEFAVAVELFVEVETATHRLSEVMGRDEKFRHVPGWFEYVSELGASLLVQATGKVFRTRRTPMHEEPNFQDEMDREDGYDLEQKIDIFEANRDKRKKEEDEHIRKRLRETQTIDPLERRSLLSLEYLVTTMFIFKASEPRDVVYSLLGIARDASPFAPTLYGQDDRKLFLVITVLDDFLAEKPFMVDYNQPYSDVARDFVRFSIEQTHKTDPAQALDILCRPWALEAPKARSARSGATKSSGHMRTLGRLLGPKRNIFHVRETPRKIEKNEEDFWGENGCKFKYRYLPIADETVKWKRDPRQNDAYVGDMKKAMKNPIWAQPCGQEGCNHTADPTCKGVKWKPSPGWGQIRDTYFPENRDPTKDIELSTWVARASRAPFMLDNAAGMDISKTSRANADPLVGSPQDGHRNYNAAGHEKLDLKSLRFQKRPALGHYSLYLRGFELDVVKKVEDASQRGSIPMSWVDLAGWTDLNKDPPDEFWRTIVAD